VTRRALRTTVRFRFGYTWRDLFATVMLILSFMAGLVPAINETVSPEMGGTEGADHRVEPGDERSEVDDPLNRPRLSPGLSRESNKAGIALPLYAYQHVFVSILFRSCELLLHFLDRRYRVVTYGNDKVTRT
jgi:hypothetical protein